MLNPTTPTVVLGLLVGGVLLLLYGVRLVSEATQRVAGVRLRHAMLLLARFPPVAFGLGTLATALMQSSGATSALLVGLVSAQLVPVTAAIVMLMGPMLALPSQHCSRH
jgi:phosphate:Na+ symporter